MIKLGPQRLLAVSTLTLILHVLATHLLFLFLLITAFLVAAQLSSGTLSKIILRPVGLKNHSSNGFVFFKGVSNLSFLARINISLSSFLGNLA